MRFKLYFNEELKKIEINCLNDNSNITHMSLDGEQHIKFPIPNDLKKDIKKILEDLIPATNADVIADIDKQIKDLTNFRREMMNNFRRELNPLIFKKCEEFRLNNAEHFI